MSTIKAAAFNDMGNPIAIASRRTPFLPVGGKHWIVNPLAPKLWDYWSVSQTRFQSSPDDGLLVSEILPQGCNVALSFAVGHGSDAVGKTAFVHIWIVNHYGAGINSEHEALELVAVPLLQLTVTGGGYEIPAESQILPPGVEGSRTFADEITVDAKYTLDDLARVIGGGTNGIASVVVDGAGGSQLLVSAQVIDDGATATGVGIFHRVL